MRVDSRRLRRLARAERYDSLIAKVIVHGADPRRGHRRMRRALDEFIIGGIRTNIPLHQALLRDPEVVSGRMSTRTIERARRRRAFNLGRFLLG